MTSERIACLLGLILATSVLAEEPQYKYKDINIPLPTANEAKRSEVSFELAEKYLNDGAVAWSKQRACVSCHTNGTYMHIRPSLAKSLGEPNPSVRRFFTKELRSLKKLDEAKRLQGITPTRIAYVAAGLAEWDAHVTKKLSPETEDAIRFMLTAQAQDGSFGNLDCWPPHESSSYHGATVAAMALATAPGWLTKPRDPKLDASVKKLENYLRTTKPPHDYGKMLLLWTSTRYKGLISSEKQQELVELLWKHQQPDGGWAMRTFAKPEEWGGGNRAQKLRKETNFGKPESDGHMTGLALILLHDAGVDSKDARITKGLSWLKSNQRVSGRWWTRSLNTDKFHFITYSATMYSVAALDRYKSK